MIWKCSFEPVIAIKALIPNVLSPGSGTGGEVSEYIKMPKEIASTIDYALKVKGMSMIEAEILEGSLVFVKVQSSADDGDIVIARKGNEYTIKRFKKTSSEPGLNRQMIALSLEKASFRLWE